MKVKRVYTPTPVAFLQIRLVMEKELPNVGASCMTEKREGERMKVSESDASVEDADEQNERRKGREKGKKS